MREEKSVKKSTKMEKKQKNGEYTNKAKENAIDYSEHKELIWDIINKYFTLYSSIKEELYQTGLIALWISSKRYDSSKGKFTTYAYKNIKYSISQYISNEQGGYSSSKEREIMLCIKKSGGKGYNDIYKEVKDKYPKINPEIFSYIYSKIYGSSLEGIYEGGGEIGVSDGYSIEKDIEDKIFNENFHERAYKALKERRKSDKAIELYFKTLYSRAFGPKITFKEIGKEYNMTKQAVQNMYTSCNKIVREIFI